MQTREEKSSGGGCGKVALGENLETVLKEGEMCAKGEKGWGTGADNIYLQGKEPNQPLGLKDASGKKQQ